MSRVVIKLKKMLAHSQFIRSIIHFHSFRCWSVERLAASVAWRETAR